MEQAKPQVFEFENTFTMRPQLAQALNNTKQIQSLAESLEKKSLTLKEAEENFSAIRGFAAKALASVEEMSEEVFDVGLDGFPPQSSGARVWETIMQISKQATVAENEGDFSSRFEKIGVLASRLSRAISDIDEDAGLRERGLA